MSRFPIPKNIVLTYFNIPARAEAIRIALRAANIPFTDKKIEFSQWPTVKPTIQPWQQLPVFEADGVTIHQSWNILLYVGKFTNLVPAEVNEEFRMNEIFFACEDLLSALNSIPAKTAEEKIAARSSLCAAGGKVHVQLQKIENFLGDREFVAGNIFTVGDCALFATLGNFISGFFDGIPATLLDDFPRLAAYHQRIAARPDVAKGYETDTRAWVKGFRVN
jgi:glutathione S-transferase